MPGGYSIENWKFFPYWVKIDQKMSQKLFSAPKMTKNRNLVFVGGFLDRIKKFKKQNMFLLGQYTPLKWYWIKILRLVLYHPPLPKLRIALIMPKLRIALIVATYFYKFEPCTANITSASAVFVVDFSRSAHSHIKSHLKNLLSNINVYVFRFESRCFGIFLPQICIRCLPQKSI